jgi:hypothetical protein
MPPPSMPPPPHDNALDAGVLLFTNYITRVHFPARWKLILFCFYTYCILFWAIGELQGVFKADVALKIRATNAMLCVLNLVLGRFNRLL